MKRVDVVYALITDDAHEKILMVQNNRHHNWSMPGGGVEKGETLKQALIRETWEETGLTVDIGSIASINEAFMKKDGNHALFFTFHAKIAGGKLDVQDTVGIAEVKWMRIQEAEQWMPYHKNGIKPLLESSSLYIFQG
ncbi:MAG TPA: NUDIX hydrolase [Candidatus Avamphibacillus sp.]|nr:NUDIX hydrolase [Candidatus Avamphibacillus sp.]